MAGQGGGRCRSVFLTVKITYYRGKEKIVAPDNLEIACQVAREDSKTLSLPPPSYSSVYVTGPGVAEFRWSSYVDSDLHKILRRRINGDLLIPNSVLNKASIKSIELYEEIDGTRPDADGYNESHPAAPYQVTVQGNGLNHPDPRTGNQAAPSISQGFVLAVPVRQQSSFPQQHQVRPAAASTFPDRLSGILNRGREALKALDRVTMTSTASPMVSTESRHENNLITNTNAIASALPPVDPLESVRISQSIESGSFSAVENRDGDVSSDTAIAETSGVGDAGMNVVVSSSLSDEEEDSIAKVIEDLFGEEASEPDSRHATPSLLNLHEAFPLHMSPLPSVSNAETKKDSNDRARTGSPSNHSIGSTPPCNRSASIRFTPPPPRASSHDQHSIRSTPPRSPSPHPQPVSIEEKPSPVSPPVKTSVHTKTSPVFLASSPPPGLNYEERGDEDGNVFNQGNVEEVSMNLETPSTLALRTPPVNAVTGKRSTSLRSVSPPPPAKRVMRGASPSDKRAESEALREYNERSEELFTMVTNLTKQEESLRRLGVPLPERDPTADNFVMRVQLRKVEAELEAERMRSRELELNLSDIRRECKQPFFVPSLFDAFLQISKLTTAATEHIP
ncbi:uncharacterized protein EV420DRAFT_1576951 [Desarmillaria tabescens]|uniref:Uncharacterized protein n=1 Tax=Armillaria tabescens TaxID=1929756 RepID=A0AA39JKN9_ARMTA|nr:uncharacterized protein EV420DRAFT_1576951 [Desarmillaria tabescens]KAK0443094.1 hypothetical protein EV420DRAFT_1576951 [Desarmillaria tabescens]